MPEHDGSASVQQASTFRPHQPVIVDGPQGQCRGIVVSASHRTGQYAVHLPGAGTFEYHWTQLHADSDPECEQLTMPAAGAFGEIRMIAVQLEQLANGLDHAMALLPSLARSARAEAQRLKRMAA